jgi:toxin ParE1/3/4
MAAYKLKITIFADQDLNDVYLEGFEAWGIEQADKYFDDLISHFDRLCENPFLFRAVDEIREGYRRSVCGKHSIYYRINGDMVEIMGVLKRQDPFKQLPKSPDR